MQIIQGQLGGVEQGHGDDAGIFVIRPVDHAQGEQEIFHAAGGRSDLRALVCEAAGLVVDARVGHAALGWLEGDDATVCGGDAQAASGICSETEGRAAGRDQGRLAAAAAAG